MPLGVWAMPQVEWRLLPARAPLALTNPRAIPSPRGETLIGCT